MKPVFTCLLLLGLLIMPPSHADDPDIRFVIVHKAGKLWNPELDMFAQPYILANPESGMEEHTHVNHYRSLLNSGKLEIGGPYPDAKAEHGVPVGMMVPVKGMTMEELADFAANDPAVVAEILEFEIRPWLIAMRMSPTKPVEN